MLLAVETSFDDTGLAVVRGPGEVVFSALSSSMELQAPYGGVVPELAARDHLKNLPLMLGDLRARLPEVLPEVRALGVTRGPGLPGCLLAGVSFARGLALSLGVPLFGLCHLEGHMYSGFFGSHPEEIPYPFLALVVSGGNTVLYHAERFGERTLFGQTLDDAAGELFDKIAVRLGLGYPGGAELERLASGVPLEAVPADLRLPVPMRESGDLNFSFSGLKTAALRMLDAAGLDSKSEACPAFARALLTSVWESLWQKVLAASEETRATAVAVTGGVAANRLLRDYLEARADAAGLKLYFPARSLTMDNAEMMAYLLWVKLETGMQAEPFDIEANLR